MIGKEVQSNQSDFQIKEGVLNMYYGLIGGGKTYSATSDIIDLLKRGEVVYCTYPINVSDFDDRESLVLSIVNLLMFRKKFYLIGCKHNLYFINEETGYVSNGVDYNEKCFDPNNRDTYKKWLGKLNHCHLFNDEAWRLFNSYAGTKVGDDTLDLALTTRHKFRSINVIAQRPTSVHVAVRGNINRFYLCQKKVIPLVGVPLFFRYEYQKIVGDTVDETEDPISKKRYIGSKRIFDSYNSYFYGDLDPLHKSFFKTFELGFWDRVKVVSINFLSLFRRLKPAKKVK